MTVGYIFSQAEIHLLTRIMGLEAPVETAAPSYKQEELDDACDSLTRSGLILRGGDDLVVDIQVSRIIRALCQRLWTITVDTIDGTRICLASGTMCILAERAADGKWVLTPARTPNEAVKLLREALYNADAECEVRLNGAGYDLRVHTNVDVFISELSRRCDGGAAKGGE